MRSCTRAQALPPSLPTHTYLAITRVMLVPALLKISWASEWLIALVSMWLMPRMRSPTSRMPSAALPIEIYKRISLFRP